MVEIRERLLTPGRDSTDDFWRVAQGLRAMKIDLDYYHTRKALDPNWDGYIQQNHDIADEDADWTEANIITSKLKDSDECHKVVLDLDHGAWTSPPMMGHGHLRLAMQHPLWFNLDSSLIEHLKYCQIANTAWEPTVHRTENGHGFVDIFTDRDFAIIPSSTPGHHHLIIDVVNTWQAYSNLLSNLAQCGIIENGYEKASKKRGFTAIRMPWIKKDIQQLQAAK